MDPTTCRLCSAVLPPDGLSPESGLRCANCGLYVVGEVGRPIYLRLAAGLAGIYGLTALVVLLTR